VPAAKHDETKNTTNTKQLWISSRNTIGFVLIVFIVLVVPRPQAACQVDLDLRGA